jgi:hypothetical protein
VFGPSERAKVGLVNPKTVEEQKNLSKNERQARNRLNLDRDSVTGSIFDVPLPDDNVSEYSEFVNHVFSKYEFDFYLSHTLKCGRWIIKMLW